MAQLNQLDPDIENYGELSDADLIFYCPYNEYIDAIDNGTLGKSSFLSLIMISSSFGFLCEEIFKINRHELGKFNQFQDSEEFFFETLFFLSNEAFRNLIALYGLREEAGFIPALCDAETQVRQKLLYIRKFLIEASKAVEREKQNQSFRKIAAVSASKAFEAGISLTDTLQ